MEEGLLYGPIADIDDYFANVTQIKRDPNSNPADYVLDILELSSLEAEEWQQIYTQNILNEDFFSNPIFFHFFGKQKPWVGKGLYSESSEIYQFHYRKHARNYYHIEHRWFPVSLKQLLISVITLKFFKIKYKLKFITIFFSGYISKKQKWLV